MGIHLLFVYPTAVKDDRPNIEFQILIHASKTCHHIFNYSITTIMSCYTPHIIQLITITANKTCMSHYDKTLHIPQCYPLHTQGKCSRYSYLTTTELYQCNKYLSNSRNLYFNQNVPCNLNHSRSPPIINYLVSKMAFSLVHFISKFTHSIIIPLRTNKSQYASSIPHTLSVLAHSDGVLRNN